jgi:amidase
LTAEATALHYLELAEVAALIQNRETSSREVTRLQLDRIAALDGELHSYALVMTDAALAQAVAGRCMASQSRSRICAKSKAFRPALA